MRVRRHVHYCTPLHAVKSRYAMASDSDHSPSRKPAPVAPTPPRVISIYQIIGLALPWNTPFKASRVFKTLFVLRPVQEAPPAGPASPQTERA